MQLFSTGARPQTFYPGSFLSTFYTVWEIRLKQNVFPIKKTSPQSLKRKKTNLLLNKD